MLLVYHKKLDENNKTLENTSEALDEKLYDVMRRKKTKLINELKTEKLLNPEVCTEADNAIEDINSCKMGTRTVGEISYYYTFLKGFYFYIHKFVKREGYFVNSIHMYCVSHGDTGLLKTIMDRDPLLDNHKM